MIIYNFNIEMSDTQNIPFEDEVSPQPGTSRPRSHSTENSNDNNNKDGSGSSGDSDDGGRDDEILPPPSKKRKVSTSRRRIRSGPSSSDEPDAMTRIERTMAAMEKRLKQLSKKRKRPRGQRQTTPEPEPEPEPERDVWVGNTMPVLRPQGIDTSSPGAAFIPRLRPVRQPSARENDNESPHLRSALNRTPQHLRSASNQHLRSAPPAHQRSATPSLLGEESEPGEDDAISLLDGDNASWPDEDPADGGEPAVDPPQGDDPNEADALTLEPEDDYEGLIGTLDFVTATEAAGPDINTAWAERLKSVWMEDNNLHSMKPLYEKYKVPSNCDTICAPTMNPEMKRLMASKWDKKSDITYSGMQKTLTKVFSAAIQLNELNMAKTHTQASKAQGMQITADITTMLGHVSYELSNQRKFHLGRVIQPHFRPLCAKDTVKPTKLLFGENVTQLIKDVQIKNKIGFRDDSRRGRPAGKGSFLAYGRGRSQGRAPRGRGHTYQKTYQNQYQNQHSHGQHKKKN